MNFGRDSAPILIAAMSYTLTFFRSQSTRKYSNFFDLKKNELFLEKMWNDYYNKKTVSKMGFGKQVASRLKLGNPIELLLEIL